MLDRGLLCGEDISKEELDKICPDSELLILEEEGHSVWVNSRILLRHNITDDTPDPVPGLDFYVRRDAHLSGNVFEAAIMPFLLDDIEKQTDEEIDEAIRRWIDYSLKNGVCAVFDAGIPEGNRFHERVYSHLRDMDRQGKLPVFIDECYVVTRKEQVPEALRELRRMKKEFNTEHLKVHTLKIFMDGTLRIETAALVTPCWHAGNIGGDPVFLWRKLLGRKRSESMYRCKTLWDSGALVTWSSDEIVFDDFATWNPYFGLEVGKDADFLIFDKDLLSAEHEGFSFNRPVAVYFGGVSK